MRGWKSGFASDLLGERCLAFAHMRVECYSVSKLFKGADHRNHQPTKSELDRPADSEQKMAGRSELPLQARLDSSL